MLEALEDRMVPAGTVTFTAGTIAIVGDNAPNVVIISDAGTGAIGSIAVSLDGVIQTNTAAATALAITVNTLGGNDTVRYNLTTDLQTGQSRTLTANLGDKNDFFQATGVETAGDTADIATGANLTLNVNGQKGRDRIFFDFSKDVDVNGGALIINAGGGQDRDTIALTYLGNMDGTLTFNLNGGQDRDRISAYVGLDSGSTGTMTGQVRGQAGNDLLALVVTASDTFTGTTTGTMDGSAGADVGIASLFVSASGVEDLFRLPF
jgi:hypothetical protein